MKFVILLLLGYCAVALARPDNIPESSTKPAKEDTSASNDSHEKDSGKDVAKEHDSGPPLVVTVIINRVIKIAAEVLGISGIKNSQDLIDTVLDNPIGKIIWSTVKPILSNTKRLEVVTREIISWIQYIASFVIPFPVGIAFSTSFTVIKYVFSTINSVLVIGVKAIT
ncbi:uncharacterized protein LOC117226623 [Megalopta genalis]|uniref:uncharacterized protein LOC117226623 n=1 Tax=Megalopta genalis TaxID=115081 RepID=UPI003FD5A569